MKGSKYSNAQTKRRRSAIVVGHSHCLCPTTIRTLRRCLGHASIAFSHVEWTWHIHEIDTGRARHRYSTEQIPPPQVLPPFYVRVHFMCSLRFLAVSIATTLRKVSQNLLGQSYLNKHNQYQNPINGTTVIMVLLKGSNAFKCPTRQHIEFFFMRKLS